MRDNNIHYVLVPNNMIQLFQHLDLMVNKHRKSYLKRLLSEWYAQQIMNQLSLGEKVEEIKVEFLLTTLKPLHAKWLVESYNEITSENGSSVIINGWKAADIYDAIKAGSSGLQSIDPFKDISPLISCHRTWWIRIVLAGNRQSINRRVAGEFCERTFRWRKLWMGAKRQWR